jgi:hypothetical protein
MFKFSHNKWSKAQIWKKEIIGLLIRIMIRNNAKTKLVINNDD